MTTPQPRVYTTARPAYLSVKAFAEYFDIGVMTAHRLKNRGEIRWIRIGNAVRIPVTELERYAKAAEQAARAEVWQLITEEES